MKCVPVLALLAVCVSASVPSPASAFVGTVYEEAGFMPVVGEELHLSPALRRRMQTSGSSTTDAPTTTTPTPTTTTATPTTTPTPTTRTPTPTTQTPTPTTATPTSTTATPSSTTATPESTTATPESTTATPQSTTATPSSTTATPSSTTATPTATTATSSGTSDTTSSGTATTTPSTTSAATSSASASSSGSSTSTSSGSSMSTGAVIGIVVGIVAAVAVLATLIMWAIRRRRETDDDPLSPFELSMDKGYSATPGFNAQNSYNPRAAGAAALGSASGSASMQTPPPGHVAAGVAYSQFYDNAATSPGSINRTEANVDSVEATDQQGATNGTNLWLSAMEPKGNDSYLSAHESPSNSSRNSYNSSGMAIDVDQSSQISGHSNKSDDFPDHHKDNDSARGSYEL